MIGGRSSHLFRGSPRLLHWAGWVAFFHTCGRRPLLDLDTVHLLDPDTVHLVHRDDVGVATCRVSASSTSSDYNKLSPPGTLAAARFTPVPPLRRAPISLLALTNFKAQLRRTSPVTAPTVTHGRYSPRLHLNGCLRTSIEGNFLLLVLDTESVRPFLYVYIRFRRGVASVDATAVGVRSLSTSGVTSHTQAVRHWYGARPTRRTARVQA